MKYYEPTSPGTWQGRKDSLPNERFFQQVKCIDLTTQPLEPGTSYCFLGFCSDEGIRRNEGRVGAKEGPMALRHQLAKLAYHGSEYFIDAGNIVCHHNALEASQQAFAHVVSTCHQQGYKTLAFGGGHEIAWAHYLGLKEHYPSLAIINIDAHFDIRPVNEQKQGTSGTPFNQIYQDCLQDGREFAYTCLGIQTAANSKSLFARAQEWKIDYLTASQIRQDALKKQFIFLENCIKTHDHIYLSICLDAFAESVAPGVSAPQPLGLTPNEVMPLLKYIAQSGKVIGLDVAELSPPLDVNQQTARLAAIIIAEWLNQLLPVN